MINSVSDVFSSVGAVSLCSCNSVPTSVSIRFAVVFLLVLQYYFY